MRTYPKDQYDFETLKELNASDWQVELLKVNPDYVYWGNFEDYMSKKDGWDGALSYPDWGSHFELDELNEMVNFYFEIYRKNHECPHCDGSGLNPETKKLSDDWYSYLRNDGEDGWSKSINESEVKALVRGGRIGDVSKFHGYYDEEKEVWMKWEGGEKIVCGEPEYPSAASVNAWASGRGFGHDAINHSICVRQRAKDLGVYGYCEHCTHGYIYDEPSAKVALQLWYLHPRKGCSRGVYIENIEEKELPEIFKYLNGAAQRNQERFSKIPTL